MAIKSAQGFNERLFIGDQVRMVGDTVVETAVDFKPNKNTGLQLLTGRSSVGIPAKHYEVVKRGPNFPVPPLKKEEK